MLDIQYLIFVMHVSGQVVRTSAINLFIVIFILECCLLLLVPLLGYLVFKNESKLNKTMNAFLIIASVCSFAFCFTFNSYFKDKSLKGASEVLLGITLLSLIIYAVLRNLMWSVYFNLISAMYIENDYRLSEFNFRAVNIVANMVRSLNTDRFAKT